MKKIEFTKAVASGNDFVVVQKDYPLSAIRYPLLAKNICDRRYGVGADGLLLLEKSKVADIKMCIFNADGSEAEMCGNGARSVAFYIGRRLKIETKAGIIEARITGNNVRIRLTEPKDYQSGIPIKINDREIKINSINTGVPHAVIFVEGIEQIDVSGLGRQIRSHECFAPSGTNVDFVEVMDKNTIRVRTYERGIEDETLACGTGAVASAIAYSLQRTAYSPRNKINAVTQGGEILNIYFDREDNKIDNVWLEGKVKIIYRGEYYV